MWNIYKDNSGIDIMGQWVGQRQTKTFPVKIELYN